ncbi:HAD-IB family hydrolase [Halovibrio salipaludis]|uniref:Histidinol-phosphatase n=1 Tax=Halovibrio salipaludis TaxID=2032626 RepID=A0A2A2F530_9GAMM|nr:HAD family hydrolase [Halovibrio salipaludis]PAU79705.1 HAD-IB family hydrolase [Halovibrio salipaludis]
MTLAIFDLDNTLLHGDSDHAWGQFLIDTGVVDGERYRQRNDQFYRDYEAGRLDIEEYLAFALEPLASQKPAVLQELRERFMQERVEPMIEPAAEALINRHRERGETLLIITATNRFVTEPIAARLGIPNLIATEPEVVDGAFTGRVAGTPCFRDGKITRLEEWLLDRSETLDGAHFYSDSRNDLPLLETVPNPVATNPDPALRDTAHHRGWPILDLQSL